MDKAKNILLAKYLRGIARYTLLIILSLVFVFAILSGSGDYGGGLKGILGNFMNGLPWLIMLLVLIVAWKWELIGGILITLLGFAALVFFVILGNNFFIAPFIISLMIILFGSFFIASWYLDKRASASLS